MIMWKRTSSPARHDVPFRTASNVTATQQADATILLDLRRGRYYTLNPVSSLIWSILAAGATIAQIRSRVQEEFDATDEQLNTDIDRFIERLLAAKLIERDV